MTRGALCGCGEMVRVVFVAKKTFIATLYLHGVRTMTCKTPFVPLYCVKARAFPVAALARRKLVGVGVVTPFAVRVRARKALNRCSLGVVTLPATAKPRLGGLMRVMTPNATVTLEERLRRDRRVAFGARLWRERPVPFVAAGTNAMRSRLPTAGSRNLSRVASRTCRSSGRRLVRGVTRRARSVLAVDFRD